MLEVETRTWRAREGQGSGEGRHATQKDSRRPWWRRLLFGE